MLWKDATEQDITAKEMHNEGPIREKIFEEKIKLKNCENLLKDEGYTESEI